MNRPTIYQTMTLEHAVDVIEKSSDAVGPIHLSGETSVWMLNKPSEQTVLTLTGSEALAVTMQSL